MLSAEIKQHNDSCNDFVFRSFVTNDVEKNSLISNQRLRSSFALFETCKNAFCKLRKKEYPPRKILNYDASRHFFFFFFSINQKIYIFNSSFHIKIRSKM